MEARSHSIDFHGFLCPPSKTGRHHRVRVPAGLEVGWMMNAASPATYFYYLTLRTSLEKWKIWWWKNGRITPLHHQNLPTYTAIVW
jgi:hypothetical protein